MAFAGARLISGYSSAFAQYVVAILWWRWCGDGVAVSGAAGRNEKAGCCHLKANGAKKKRTGSTGSKIELTMMTLLDVTFPALKHEPSVRVTVLAGAKEGLATLP